MLSTTSRVDSMKRLSVSSAIVMRCSLSHSDHHWIRYVGTLFFSKKEPILIKLCTFFIGLKCGNSKWAVKVVWVRYSLLPLVHLAAILATNTFCFLLICRNEGKLQNYLNVNVLLTDLLLTVANLFEPSVDGKCAVVLQYPFLFSLFVSSAAVTAIKAQIEASNGIIKVRPYIYFLSTLI